MTEREMLPKDVRLALDRMCRPLDESVLSGETAKEDARCMKIIRDFIYSAAALAQQQEFGAAADDCLHTGIGIMKGNKRIDPAEFYQYPESQQQEAEPVACGGTFISVPVDAIDWLKEKFPDLCIKAGLCKRIAGRLYTRTTMDAHPPKPAAQPQVPEGYQLVPVEPTQHMLHEAYDNHMMPLPYSQGTMQALAANIYKTMLSAAKEDS